MPNKRPFVLVNADVRRRVADYALNGAPDGHAVVFSEPTRNLEQSAKFHAICGDLSKQLEWAGSKRNLDAWKFLLISGHSIATNRPTEIVPGLEGEFLNIRESSASMSKLRMTSLIEYCLAFCSQKNVELSR